MSPRPRKIEDEDIFSALVRVMLRVGPTELTLAAIAAEAGVTAGALVQRFGSKREMMQAHARHAANTGDIGLGKPVQRKGSALRAIRASTDPYARLATTPDAALRNLAYLQRDMADPALHANLLRMSRAARSHYEQLIAEAIHGRELRPGTRVRALARTIEITLVGSYLSWAIHREGSAARWLRTDLDAVLQPHLALRSRAPASLEN